MYGYGSLLSSIKINKLNHFMNKRKTYKANSRPRSRAFSFVDILANLMMSCVIKSSDLHPWKAWKGKDSKVPQIWFVENLKRQHSLPRSQRFPQNVRRIVGLRPLAADRQTRMRIAKVRLLCSLFPSLYFCEFVNAWDTVKITVVSHESHVHDARLCPFLYE